MILAASYLRQGEALNQCCCRVVDQLRNDETVIGEGGVDNKVESGRIERMKALSSARKGIIPVRTEP